MSDEIAPLKKIHSDLENFSLQDFLSEKIECTFDQVKKFVREQNFISMLPSETKLIILIDIVNFSKNESKTQFADIIIFQKYMRTFIFSRKFSFGKKIHIENFVPTGDGCYIIAEKCSPELAMDFLVTMIAGFQNLLDYNDKPMSIRSSALFGECIPFMDLAHHKNYVGEGMNEAARILSYGQQALEEKFIRLGHTELEAKDFSKNSLFLGESFYSAFDIDSFTEEKSEEKLILNDVQDKHGKCRDVMVLRRIKQFK